MKIRFRSEDDDWTTIGPKINDEEILATLQRKIDDEGPVLLRHEFYRGSSAPDWHAFNTYDDFTEFLNESCSAGDRITVWFVFDFLDAATPVASGKCPDENGMVPTRGAY